MAKKKILHTKYIGSTPHTHVCVFVCARTEHMIQPLHRIHSHLTLAIRSVILSLSSLQSFFLACCESLCVRISNCESLQFDFILCWNFQLHVHQSNQQQQQQQSSNSSRSSFVRPKKRENSLSLYCFSIFVWRTSTDDIIESNGNFAARGSDNCYRNNSEIERKKNLKLNAFG